LEKIFQCSSESSNLNNQLEECKKEIIMYKQRYVQLTVDKNQELENLQRQLTGLTNQQEKQQFDNQNESRIRERKIEQLENEIRDFKKNIATEDKTAKKHQLENQEKLIKLDKEIIKYEKIVHAYEELKRHYHNQTLEITNLKENATREAVLLISSKVKEIIVEPENPVQLETEYKLFLKAQGFEDIEQQLKEIVLENKDKQHENQKLKYQLEKLTQKYKELYKGKTKDLKNMREELNYILEEKNKRGKSLIDYFFLYKRKEKKKQIK